MDSLYNFVSGPLVWLAFIIFIGGCLYRLITLIVLVHKKEKFIYSYMSWKYSLRSIVHWSTPFATENMRRHPAMTIVAYLFHICLILTPIFLLAHVTLVDESWDLSWWTLPDKLALAVIMTVIVIGACVFFLVRRLSGGSVCHVSVGLYPAGDRRGAVYYRVFSVLPVVWISNPYDSAYPLRRNHAGGHSVYPFESHAVCPVDQSLYGIGIWRGQACQRLVKNYFKNASNAQGLC